MTEETGADASLEPEVAAVEPDGEAVEAEVTESEAESPPAEETEQKPDPFQERIDKLTRRFRETERENLALKKQLEDAAKKSLETPAKEPEKSLEDFDFDEAKYRSYLLTEAEKRAEAAAERVAKQYQSKSEELAIREQYVSREKDFAKTVPDFYEVTMSESLDVSGTMVDEIERSDIGPELVYYLGKNIDEAARIARMPERSAIREMVLLENKLKAAKEKPAKTVSNAPPPAKKIDGAEPGLKISTKDPKSDELSDEEWFKREAARQAKLRN